MAAAIDEILIHIFHFISQVVCSLIVTYNEIHCNLQSASNTLLHNTCNFKVHE